MQTPYRAKKTNRDKAIYAEYQRLIGVPGAMKTAVEQAVMKKFKIYSRSTIWQVCQRVELATKAQAHAADRH